MELLEANLRENYSAVRVMMARALDLQEGESRGARQDKLQADLQGTIEESSYCLLNDLLLVEIPVSDDVRDMSRTSRERELCSTLAKVLKKASQPSVLLSIVCQRRKTAMLAVGSTPQQCAHRGLGSWAWGMALQGLRNTPSPLPPPSSPANTTKMVPSIKAALEKERSSAFPCLSSFLLVAQHPPEIHGLNLLTSSPGRRLRIYCCIPLSITCFFLALGEFGIFVIDNARFIDPASWSIISTVLKKVSVFMVVSLAQGYARTETFHKDAEAAKTTSQIITYLHLDKLKPSAVVKACQDLSVVSIPRDLARQVRGRGALLREGGPPEAQANRRPVPFKGEVSLCPTCWLPCHAHLTHPHLNCISPSFCCAGHCWLDQRRLLEQLFLRFADVIGPVFITQLLWHILPTSMRKEMNSILDILVSNNILTWRLGSTEVPHVVRDATTGPADSLQAKHGRHGGIPLEQDNWEAAVWHSGLACPSLWVAAYNLWPKRQRVASQCECAAFLEQHAHPCESCGQGDFVAFHHFAVSSSQDGGSCEGLADQGNSCSWVALLLAEQMKRDRTRTMECMLCTVCHSVDPPGGNGGAAGELLGKSKEVIEHSGTCECEAIVESVLVPLARHSAMGDAARAFYYLLERAAAYMAVSNSYMALMKLNKPEVLRNSVKQKEEMIAHFEEGTFFSLKGEVCCHMGHRKQAKEMIRKGLSLLGSRFPRTSVGTLVLRLVMELHRVTSIARRASSLPQEARRKKLAWLLWQSCCFSLLEHLFIQEGTSSGQMFSQLAACMKANTDRVVECYRQQTP
ncbi:LOW QUALITY PROTEIN: adenylate cyclase type 10-like [Porphyrio hochstetteri]